MIADWIKRIGSILVLLGVVAGIVGLLPVLWPGASASGGPSDAPLLIASAAAIGLGLVLIAVAMFGAAMFGPTGYED